MALQQIPDDLIRDKFFEDCASPRRVGRIVVVGNSRLDQDHSKLVDSADCVIRFSKLLHYNDGLTGTKTDVVVLRAAKAFVWEKDVYVEQKMVKFMSEVRNFQPWNDCKEFWIGGKYLNHSTDVQPYILHYPRIADVPLRLMHISALSEFCFGHYRGENDGPITNGIITILHLLSIRALLPWTIQLVGFKHFDDSIAPCHNVDKDKELLQNLAQMGYIEMRD